MLASKKEIDNPHEPFLTYIVQLVFFGMNIVHAKSPENGELMASLI